MCQRIENCHRHCALSQTIMHRTGNDKSLLRHFVLGTTVRQLIFYLWGSQKPMNQEWEAIHRNMQMGCMVKLPRAEAILNLKRKIKPSA